MGKYCQQIKIAYAIRGSLARGEKVTAHIIFGAPGTILDWIFQMRAFDPKKIRVFVLDEADVIIDAQGHKNSPLEYTNFYPNNVKCCYSLQLMMTNL